MTVPRRLLHPLPILFVRMSVIVNGSFNFGVFVPNFVSFGAPDKLCFEILTCPGELDLYDSYFDAYLFTLSIRTDSRS